jgi:hypothetical protein
MEGPPVCLERSPTHLHGSPVELHVWELTVV